jgi:polysaccharide export outer membrane protein
MIAALLVSFLINGCVLQPVDSTMTIHSPGDIAVETTSDETVSTNDTSAYRLQPLDPLYIRFSGIQEQQQLELVIDEKGEISLLHLEPFTAAGMTTSELEQKIEKLYVDNGIYKNVSINVTMTAMVFYVQGEVNQPGQFPLTTGTTLLQAIAGARGYTAFAWKTKLTISRHGKIYRFNMKELEKDPSKDVKIEAGDVIKVPQHWY